MGFENSCRKSYLLNKSLCSESVYIHLANMPMHFINPHIPLLLAHLSRRLRGELIVYRSSRRPSVRASVCTLSNMNISETNGSIATKFYLKHHWGGGLAA